MNIISIWTVGTVGTVWSVATWGTSWCRLFKGDGLSFSPEAKIIVVVGVLPTACHSASNVQPLDPRVIARSGEQARVAQIGQLLSGRYVRGTSGAFRFPAFRFFRVWPTFRRLKSSTPGGPHVDAYVTVHLSHTSLNQPN
jgi:hypothetical protein